jgi:hypothetical protein
MTKNDAVKATGTLYHAFLTNRDGSALRCRVNGRCKTWKTRPQRFRLPVKYGLKTCFYITPENAHEWLLIDPREYYDVLEEAHRRMKS